MQFGELFRSLRLKNKWTLRRYCMANNFDPANISRIERGVYQAPREKFLLERYAHSLLLVPESAEWLQFFDLAATSNRTFHLHEDMDEVLVAKLPAFLRPLTRRKWTEASLDKLIDFVRELDTSTP